MFLYFDILTWPPTLNLGSSLLFSLSKLLFGLDFNINRLHFDYAMIYIVVYIQVRRQEFFSAGEVSEIGAHR